MQTDFDAGERVVHEALPELDIKPEHRYYPHYFVKPTENTPREPQLISHAKAEHNNEKLHSGKIKCKLTTLGPIFVPDTNSAENKEGEHKSFSFYKINNKYAIPGSELRGMISSVYETITNSCYRIMEENKYISRRMEAKEAVGIKAGIVVLRKNKYFIKEAKSYRLPLYDDLETTKKTEGMNSEGNFTNQEKRTKEAKLFNLDLAKCANNNLECLKDLKKKNIAQFKPVFSGKKKIGFDVKCNYKDEYAKINSTGKKEGYIKISGFNNANIANECNGGIAFNPDWSVDNLNVFLISDPEPRPSRNQKYPRPVLKCIKDNVQYTVTKRCERIFEEISGGKPVEIPLTVVRQYNDKLEDYKKNKQNIEPLFRTIFPNEGESGVLEDGALVYFKKEKGCKVSSVVPVSISRNTDDEPMVKRLLHDSLRPCTVETSTCAEECEDCPERCKKVADYFSPHPEGLCPACHLFGTPYYKGRVNFGFAWLDDKADKWFVPKDKHQLTLKLLERPRPTWSIPESATAKPGGRIPGRKFYVHHPASVESLRNNKNKDKNSSTVTPLAESNTFSFELQFNNLRDWELGLLIYSLELENGLAHKLGMAKPLGFGSVQIDVTGIGLRNRDTITKKQFLEKGFK